MFAGGAVLLAEVALLSQSRGSLYATPVMLVLVFALLPGRMRTFAMLVPVALGIAAAAPAVLRVGDHLNNGAVVPATSPQRHPRDVRCGRSWWGSWWRSARRSRAGEPSQRPPPGGYAWALGAAAIATLIAILAGGLVAAGNPVTRIRHGWDTFKSGYVADSRTGSRLISGLGSNRYDFYRVALDEFAAHPILGIGADNFQQQYLAHGRSEETPHYPHSVELRTLVQTGLVGALLAVVGLGAALLAGGRAVRPGSALIRSLAMWPPRRSRASPTGSSTARSTGSGSSPVWARPPLRCSAWPAPWEPPRGRAPRGRNPPGCRRRPYLRRPGAGAGGPSIAATSAWARAPCWRSAAALSLAAPWFSQLQVQSAARIWTYAPQKAYARLSDAARLNPLSDEAYLVAGGIALRYGELTRADHEFSLALGRSPGDAYAVLERGAIASTRGERREALRLLERAARLNPRDPLTRQALVLVRAGQVVSVQELNRSILQTAQQLA